MLLGIHSFILLISIDLLILVLFIFLVVSLSFVHYFSNVVFSCHSTIYYNLFCFLSCSILLLLNCCYFMPTGWLVHLSTSCLIRIVIYNTILVFFVLLLELLMKLLQLQALQGVFNILGCSLDWIIKLGTPLSNNVKTEDLGFIQTDLGR